jgi:hypothetical protein
MRTSAIYTYNDVQYQEASEILDSLQSDFDKKVITRILPFTAFKVNKEELVNYFYNSPNKPFCKTYIHPKLKLLLTRFKNHVDSNKLAEKDYSDIEAFKSCSSYSAIRERGLTIMPLVGSTARDVIISTVEDFK